MASGFVLFFPSLSLPNSSKPLVVSPIFQVGELKSREVKELTPSQQCSTQGLKPAQQAWVLKFCLDVQWDPALSAGPTHLSKLLSVIKRCVHISCRAVFLPV